MYIEEILEYFLIGTFFGLGWIISRVISDIITIALKALLKNTK